MLAAPVYGAPRAESAGDQAAQPKGKAPAVKPGDAAPTFVLKDLAGKEVDLASLTRQNKIIVLEWFNPECDWVAKYHQKSRAMADTYRKFAGKDVAWLAINSTTTGKGGDAERNRQVKAEWGIDYPILMDADGRVARLYGASVTPQVFIINREGKIAYTGAVDDAPKVTDPGKHNHLQDALTRLVASETIDTPTTEAQGCPITGPGN